MISKKRGLLALGILLISGTLVWAAPTPIVVCYPGGPVKDQEANNAMGSMLRVVERVGQWSKGNFDSIFTTKAEECKKLIHEKKPAFSIMSLGLFLELKDQRTPPADHSAQNQRENHRNLSYYGSKGKI